MTTADIFNVGVTLTDADGKTYQLRKPNQYEQGLFQRQLEQEAHDAIDRSNATEEQKDRRHHLVDVKAGLGMYQYEGEYGYAARFIPAGMVRLLQIVLRDQGITEEKAEELVRRKFREIAAEFIGRAVKDPKAMAQVLACLGLPTDWLPSGENNSSCKLSSTHPSTEPSENSPDSMTTNSCSSTPSNAESTG